MGINASHGMTSEYIPPEYIIPTMNEIQKKEIIVVATKNSENLR